MSGEKKNALEERHRDGLRNHMEEQPLNSNKKYGNITVKWGFAML